MMFGSKSFGGDQNLSLSNQLTNQNLSMTSYQLMNQNMSLTNQNLSYQCQWNQNLQQLANKLSQALKKSTSVFMITTMNGSWDFMKKFSIYLRSKEEILNFSSIGPLTSDTMMKSPLSQFIICQQRNLRTSSIQDSKNLKMSLSSL